LQIVKWIDDLDPYRDERHFPMDETHPTPRSSVNVGRLLLRAFELFRAGIVASIEEAGHGDIRAADTRVFRSLDPDGAGITDLAERAGVTKQAMSQLIQDLEERGYVERRPDPEDGRCKRVVLTDVGRDVIRAARDGRRRLEERWSRHLGEKGLSSLQTLLIRLLEAEDAIPEVPDPLDWEEP
jgi:DNA-binding MarR family transcriptional regulator